MTADSIRRRRLLQSVQARTRRIFKSGIYSRATLFYSKIYGRENGATVGFNHYKLEVMRIDLLLCKYYSHLEIRTLFVTYEKIYSLLSLSVLK